MKKNVFSKRTLVLLLSFLVFCYLNILNTAKAEDVSDFTELQAAITAATSINLQGNITVTANLNNVGQSTLTIYGNNYSINGDSYKGTIVSSGQTLSIENVGNIATPSINKGFHNFVSTSSGGVVANAGNLSVSNSVFDSNTISAGNGGVISNMNGGHITFIANAVFNNNSNTVSGGQGGALFNYGYGASSIIDTIENSNFISNSADNGGAIANNNNASNTGTITTIEGVTFDSNTATTAGGAIYNTGVIGTIKDAYFNNNTTNTGNTDGGAIYNSRTINTIENTTFSGNSSGDYGGAIHNTGSIGTIDGTFTNNTAGNEGGAITNTGSITTITGTFGGDNASDGNSATQGGAIANYSGIGTINATFKNNSSTATGTNGGGAIINAGSGSSITTVSGTFENNQSAGYGGAVFNKTTGSTAVSISTISGSFTGNSAAQGGAIANYSGTIGEISGTFSGNTSTSHGGTIINDGTASAVIDKISGIFDSNSSTGGVGGVMFLSSGSVNDLSGTFTNNTANASEGGAIYSNQNTTLNITTTSGNTLFSGNTDSSGSNAIRNGGTINMNAGSGRTITFDDKIAGGGSGAKAININDSSIFSTMTAGTVVFNNTVTGNAITLNAGTMKLGLANAIADATSLTINGGTIDLTDGTIANQNLGSVTLNSDINLKVDAALAGTTPVADVISGTIVNATTDYRIKINGINVLSDFTDSTYTAQVADDSIKAYVTLATTPLAVDGASPSISYLVTYDNTNGLLSFAYSGLYSAIKQNVAEKSYTMATDETVPSGGYGNLVGTKLTINGNGNSVDGSSQVGIKVSAGQELVINNVGIDSTGTVQGDGFNNFSKTGNGSVISNAGTLTVSDSVFKTNTATSNGGAVFNASTGTISSLNSNFTSNNTSDGGGAIFNSGTITTLNGKFTSNTATTYGGAIDNSGTINDLSGTFTNNIAANYGGAIFNSNSKTISITTTGGNTLFSGNTDSSGSNAIRNNGIVNLNAASTKSITFNDAISGYNGTININDATVKSTMVGGDYIFNNTVSGNSINLYNNGTITVGSGGNLTLNAFTNDANGGTLDLANTNYEAVNLGVTTLGSVLKAAIDVSANGTSADTITVGAGSTGTIQLTSLGSTAFSAISSATATEVSKQILLGSDGNTSLSLSDDLVAAYAYSAVDDTKTGTDILSSSSINVNDEYGTYTQNVRTTKGISITESETGKRDTLTYTVTKTAEGAKTYTDKGDNLNLINVSTINDGDGQRNFNFNDASESYTLTQNTGTTAAGTLNVNGVYNEGTNTRSTINANGKTMFTLSNTGSIVKIKNVKIDNATQVATNVASGNTLKISNSEITNSSNFSATTIKNAGNTIIEGSNFASNGYNYSYGGAVDSSNNLYVDNSTFTSNTGRNGGAIRVTNGNTSILNSTFSSNIGRASTGAIEVTGGNVFIDNSTFDNNYSPDYSIGAINVGSGTTVTAKDSTFTNNHTVKNNTRAGAISVSGILNVISEAKNALFSGNYGYNNASNSIYNTGTVNLNALTTDYDVDIEDAITGSNGTININNAISYNYLTKDSNDVLSVASRDITIAQSIGKVIFGNNVSGNDVNVYAGTLENKGTLSATSTVTNAGTLDNTGTINTTNLTNTGSISNTSTITAANLANTGSITGATGTLALSGTSSNSGTGTGAGITQATVSNSGTFTNSAALTATSGLTNTGSISNTSTITAANLANTGSITGATGTLTLSGTSSNSGTGTGAGITQATVSNSGTFTNSAALTATTFTNTGSVTNTALLTADNVINTGTGSLTTAITNLANTNAIQNDGTLTLTGAGAITAGITSYTTGAGTVDIQAGASSTVTLNDSIENNIIKLTSGTLLLDNNTGSADITSATKILANGGALSIQDDKVASIALGNVDLTTNSINLSIDADLSQASVADRADKISGTADAGTSTNKILINDIKLTTDAGYETEMDIQVADSGIASYVDLGSSATISGTNIGSMFVTYNNTTGNLHAAHSDLENAIKSTVITKAYVLDDTDLNITSNLPALQGNALSITGGNKTLTGNDNAGFVLSDNGQSLSLNDLTMNDFSTAVNNSIGGTVNLKNVTFGSDNTTAVNNEGTMDLSGTTNTFNSAVTGGGTTTVSEGTTNINTSFAQSQLTINDGASVSANASNLTISDTTNGITNNGTLTFSGGTNNNVITSTKTAGGDISLTGNLANAGSISSNNISATTNNLLNTGSISNGTITSTTGNITNSGASSAITNAVIQSTSSGAFSNEGSVSGGSITTASGNITNSNSMTGLTSINSTSGNLDLLAGSTTSATDISLGSGTLAITDDAALSATNPVSITSGHVTIAATNTDSALTAAITGSYDVNTSSAGTTTATIDAAISGATSITAAAGSNLKLTQNATNSTSAAIQAGTNGTVTLSNTDTADVTVNNNISGSNYELNVENTNGKTLLVQSTVSGADKINVNSGTMAINDSSNISTTPVYLNNTADFEINTTQTGYSVSNNVIGTDKTENDVVLKGAADTQFSLGSSISVANVLLSSGTLNLPNQNNLTNSSVTVGTGATLNTINHAVGSYTDVIFQDNSQVKSDVNVLTATADNFISATEEGSVVLTDVNIMNAEQIVQNSKTINLRKAMGLSNLVVSDDLQKKRFPVLTPIRRMTGYISSTGNLTFAPNGDRYEDFNPAVMASPVAAQLGGYLTQLNSYDEAFRNMDMYMLLPQEERKALKYRNRYASAADDSIVYNSTLSQYENKSAWFRPYATFENVPLRHGPKVSNVAYGSFFGGDSKLYDMGHGWEGMFSAYVGYNGSHQTYDGIGIYQNGGTLGATGIAYKGNFFTGLTLNVGANAGEAHTFYGREDFSMLMSGIASKTGYNIELAKGKFIIQPSYLMSYSFINTFDYKNAARVNIDSDALHAIQIEPGIKFIGNLKNGWQPYASVNMVWNIMDKTNFMANDVTLPSLAIRPFVKYGVGIRKSWGESFTGYFQTYLTNGGRNGVGMQSGFQWLLGEKQNKNIKNTTTKTIKQEKPKTSSKNYIEFKPVKIK